jgi:fumarate hydratase class II
MGTRKDMSSFRTERDSMGDVQVRSDALWGAVTQRSLTFFAISTERMPRELISALARIKRVCAQVNCELGLLSPALTAAIAQAADEVAGGKHWDAFPLSIWQTGSGTQTNMNMNEVLANRASEMLGGGMGRERLVHANDHVNLGHSSNDIFPTAMHLAALQVLSKDLLPALVMLRLTLQHQAQKYSGLFKLGRTHLQDATPITFGQEISGWGAQLDHAHACVEQSLLPLMALAVGGTAVGTGLNTHPEFGSRVTARLSTECSLPLHCAENRFSAIAAHDALVSAHGAIKTLAVALMKIANDVRWLASGPRAGLGEIHLPENEPGSSIMPGKVNPTQCEALAMVCCQVMGNDVALGIGGAMGSFELNAFKPLITYNFLQSVRLLSDAMRSFDTYCMQGMVADAKKMTLLLESSLMLVTALTPHIGYDRAAAIAKAAHAHGTSLREEALASKAVTAAEFDDWVQVRKMV